MNLLTYKVIYLPKLLNIAGAELPPVCTSICFIFSSKTDYMTKRVRKIGLTLEFSGFCKQLYPHLKVPQKCVILIFGGLIW